MALAITLYEANDGSRHETLKDAEKQDKKIEKDMLAKMICDQVPRQFFTESTATYVASFVIDNWDILKRIVEGSTAPKLKSESTIMKKAVRKILIKHIHYYVEDVEFESAWERYCKNGWHDFFEEMEMTITVSDLVNVLVELGAG